MSKQVILTGLRANNDLHIGNYLGALLPMIDMAKRHAGEYQINMFVPDLHSFTTPIDHSKLQEAIMNNLRVFVAAGLPLDNPDIHIYRQSYIPAHSELTWILDCFTGFGEMFRMTQFRDKSELAVRDEDIMNVLERQDGSPKHVMKEAASELRRLFLKSKQMSESSKSSVGLFNYPVLMAADILMYGATYVPVGDDQSQHLEFTRDIAERMNNKFGDLFVVPKPVKEQHKFFGKDQGLRIRDLMDPAKKMSKSDESGKGVIFLNDDPQLAAKKILSATTDSVGVVNYDPANQPGIGNLLQIHALLSGESLDKVIEHHKGETNYGDLKKEVAQQIEEFLMDFQAKLAKIDDAEIYRKLEISESEMSKQANQTLLKVQQAVGLRSR